MYVKYADYSQNLQYLKCYKRHYKVLGHMHTHSNTQIHAVS